MRALVGCLMALLCGCAGFVERSEDLTVSGYGSGLLCYRETATEIKERLRTYFAACYAPSPA